MTHPDEDELSSKNVFAKIGQVVQAPKEVHKTGGIPVDVDVDNRRTRGCREPIADE